MNFKSEKISLCMSK